MAAPGSVGRRWAAMPSRTEANAVMRQALSEGALDCVLTAQLVVAWAGEAGDPPRMKWWRTDLASEFGGEDLFRRLLPHTWRWAVLEGAREAARRHDAELRGKDADPERLVTLFRLGLEIDERVGERLAELKRAGAAPVEALPGVREIVGDEWTRAAFAGWIAGHGETAAGYGEAAGAAAVGRRIGGEMPESIEEGVRRLVAALHPLVDAYPMPHYRSAGVGGP
jgi:hypothetical protein